MVSETASQPPAWRKRKPGRPGRKLRCDCGRLAVAVVTVQVGLDAVYTVQMPLCEECLKLEQDLWG